MRKYTIILNMDKIDQLLNHVTTNCDSILNHVTTPDPEDLSLLEEDEFEETLLEMIEDGTIELVDIDGVTHYKLTEKGHKENIDNS